MEHSFDIEIAKTYGIEEAIILRQFQYLITSAPSRDIIIKDGAKWINFTIRGLLTTFPYMSQKKLFGALNNLNDRGLIMYHISDSMDGNFLFALTDYAKSILK